MQSARFLLRSNLEVKRSLLEALPLLQEKVHLLVPCLVHLLSSALYRLSTCAIGAEDFQEYFAKFGSVSEAQIMVDHQTGRSRGFG